MTVHEIGLELEVNVILNCILFVLFISFVRSVKHNIGIVIKCQFYLHVFVTDIHHRTSFFTLVHHQQSYISNGTFKELHHQYKKKNQFLICYNDIQHKGNRQNATCGATRTSGHGPLP